MIRVFGPTNKSYPSNGNVIVRPLKATVHKEDNGDFYLVSAGWMREGVAYYAFL